MAQTVLIVESPTKAKSIQSFLGNDYIVKASMGHVADLPARPSKGHVGVRVSFPDGPDSPPKVEFPDGMPVLPDKKALVEGLKGVCRGKQVLLATDPDREGEAIAWCLQNLLSKTAAGIKRVTFDAITPESVKKGLSKPRDVDLHLVAAQLGRRSLDRLFGYELSGLASRSIGMDRLSVGRVQTAVLSMVVDREREIENFKPEPRYAVTLVDGDGNKFRSKVFEKLEDAEKLLAKTNALLASGRMSVVDVASESRKEPPQPPFKTGTMQQEASKLLGMSPKKTMEVAQSLFEKHHLITYHRSDSIRIEDETRAAQAAFAAAVWPDLVPEKPTTYKNTGGAQDAHECIHPTYFDSAHSPSGTLVAGKLTPDELALYNLVWGRFHGSLAKPAVWDVCSVRLGEKGGGKGDSLLSLQGRRLAFDGWRRLDPTASKSSDKTIVGTARKKGDVVVGNASIDKTMTKPPAYYSTPDLLKDMEANGVGRPATMAASVGGMFDKKYAVEVVEEKKRKIRSTPLGRAIVDFSGAVCPELRDVEYTSRMENELDEVQMGQRRFGWKGVVADFYKVVIVPSVEKARRAVLSGEFRMSAPAAAGVSEPVKAKGARGTRTGSAKGGTSKNSRRKVEYGGPQPGL